ncbi:DUF3300 domain-containing protein, partial [Salmonella enterica subsp. enterica serovar Kentucky]|nr:DUF3300 domain-containing protein [Salmonella enterica subsp. enterica serovar Kentucky]
NYNRITGENRRGNTMPWHPNPAYRNGMDNPDTRVVTPLHRPASATDLIADNRASQRQAAAARFQQATGHNATVNTGHQPFRHSLQERAQRSNYRGYDIKPESARLARHAHNASERPFHDATRHAPYRDLHASAFSGNDSRSARWQVQQQRGIESRHLAAAHRPDTPVRERHIEHRQHERHH